MVRHLNFFPNFSVIKVELFISHSITCNSQNQSNIWKLLQFTYHSQCIDGSVRRRSWLATQYTSSWPWKYGNIYLYKCCYKCQVYFYLESEGKFRPKLRIWIFWLICSNPFTQILLSQSMNELFGQYPSTGTLFILANSNHRAILFICSWKINLSFFKKCTEYHSKEMPTQIDSTETNQEV